MLAAMMRRRGWTMPVAIDTDGAVVDLYDVGGCPTTVFAREGGTVQGTSLANLSENELRRRVRRLVAPR